jgi:elongation factor G
VDAILYKLGINDRHGSTDDGTSMADWNDEEKERKISIWAKPFDVIYEKNGRKTNMVFIDTPGYVDFFGQVIAASASSDTVLLTVDASSGIQVGTNRAWRRAETLQRPRGIVITGIDKDNTDFQATLESIQGIWGATRCVPVVIPTSDKKGVIDILAAKDVPADMADKVSELKTALVENAAETDDALLEKYLGGEDLSPEEISKGLEGAVAAGTLIPVFATCAKQEVGITELLDGLVNLFPSPIEHEVKTENGEIVDPSRDAPFIGQVWRSITDPFVGQLTFVRVFGGTFSADSEVHNANTGQKERIGTLYCIQGKKQEKVTQAAAGDIVAVAKLKNTNLNDTLCSMGTDRKMPPIQFPNTVMSYSVQAKTQGDEDKLGVGLTRICDEDPTLNFGRNDETHEQILSGMGDVHLDIAVKRLKQRNNVDVVLSTPKVAYKETVTGKGEGHYKHKKQSGGRGQYGDVYLRVWARDPDDEEWFVNSIFGGAIPSGFIPAIEKGLHEGMAKGAVAGAPVINVKVEVYDGSYHDVDSSEIAFKIAGARAFREAMMAAKPVLLEPIMTVKVMIPDQFMGDITGDLNHRRGRILGFATEDGMQVITADVPQAEMFQYSSQIRSITGGQGSFEMEFSRYETVPANVAQKIVAAAEKEKEESD